MTERVARLRAEAAADVSVAALRARIDDLLTEGYLAALDGDAWSISAEHELHDLLNEGRLAAGVGQLQDLVKRHTAVQMDLLALRRELSLLRRERDRLHVRPAAAPCEGATPSG